MPTPSDSNQHPSLPSSSGQSGSEVPPSGTPPASTVITSPVPPVDPEAARNAPGPTSSAAPDNTHSSGALPDPEATNYSPAGAGPPTGLGPCRLGDYELLEEIARGGMGVVFKARQVNLDRLVALKMILAGRFSAPGALERFRLEARAAAALNHHGIVPVYDIDEAEGQPFYTMPLIAGGSLHQVLGGGPLPPTVAARLLRQVAEAVQCAHDHGIIHRDLKPQNILLQRDKGPAALDPNASTLCAAEAAVTDWPAMKPMLTDFGLARAASEGSGLTKTGEAMGTPSFMPPEQARGDLQSIGPRSDVYSLGAVLYCALTGRPPFQSADPHETMRQVREDEPAPPRRLNPQVPHDLETVCLKCLAKEPEQRYASARQMAEDLDCFLADQPLRHARRAGPLARVLRRAVRAVQRRPMRAAYLLMSLAAFVALAVILLGILFDRLGQFDRLLKEARDAEVAAEQAKREGRLNRAHDSYARALEKYNTLIDKYPDRPDLIVRRAHVYTLRGSLQVDARQWRAAMEEFESARKELTALRETRPGDTACLLELAEVCHRQGTLHEAKVSSEDRRKALDYYQESLNLRKELCTIEPGNRNFRRDLARSHGYMGDTELALGLEKKAWQSYMDAEVLRKELVNEKADDREEQLVARYQLARSWGNRALYHEWTSNLQKAMEWRRTCLSDVEEFHTTDAPAEFQTDLAYASVQLAQLQLDDTTARPEEETKELLESALEVYQRLTKAAEGSKSWTASVAQIRVNLSKYYRRTDQREAAEAHLQTALSLLRNLTEDSDSPPLADDLYHLALAYALHNDLETAVGRPSDEERVLGTLERAAKRGYKNVARLKREIGFRSLKDKERFQKIVDQIQGERDKIRREEDS